MKKSNKPKSSMAVYFYIICIAVFAGLTACGYLAADKAGLIERPAPMTSRLDFATDMAYYDLPRMMVSVGNGSQRTRAQVDISIEVAKKDVRVIEGYQPRIADRLNSFFSFIRPDEARQFGSLPWVREEMLREVNSTGVPVPVHDLLLRRMIIM